MCAFLNTSGLATWCFSILSQLMIGAFVTGQSQKYYTVVKNVTDFVQTWIARHVLCNIGWGGHRFWTFLKCPNWHIGQSEFTQNVRFNPLSFHSCRGVLPFFLFFYVGAYFS